ncbi:MAG: VWA domain-containing protein [Okeania sp. SIO2C2]|uniref:VWA domain-containing protein n=1 Tax=Okeania sp. SIO2C2 TaxID=2607787 RepID=UPI0013BD60E9|nr:VWA domain-containing protein [Okeania sp. SIO2C2]NEP87621.1 VWA domain-containing protein [Okeania sp. SIO2C2]
MVKEIRDRLEQIKNQKNGKNEQIKDEKIEANQGYTLLKKIRDRLAQIKNEKINAFPNWGYFSWMYKIEKKEVITISKDEIGLVEAKYGSPLEKGKSFGRKVDCNNFQHTRAFIKGRGQAGQQLAHLEVGTYKINTEIFNIRIVPIISIRPGEIGLVIANYGASPKQILGKVVECDSFQDAEAFLNSGGQRGKQLAILTTGKYKINTDLFTVITTANAHKNNENPENLKVYKIDKGKIGIVTTMAGKTLPKDEIAGPEIEGHDNYQDGQKFLDLGGYKGLQEEVLKEGEWNLNPWFVKVEQVPLTRIEQEEVGVVVSFVGKKYDRHNYNQGISSDESEYIYELVPEGYKGVQKEPLMAGDYPINTRTKTVHLVPTTLIVLNWSSDEEKHPLDYDYKLNTLKLTSSDGREFQVQFTQIIRIAAENAPMVICQIGTSAAEVERIYMNDNLGRTIKKYPAIRNFVNRVLTKVVEGHFKHAATAKTAIQFQQTIIQCQEEAQAYIEAVLEKYGIERWGTYIIAFNLPEELDKHRQVLEDLKQEQVKAQEESKTIQEKIQTEEKNKQLTKEQEETKAVGQKIQADTKVYTAQREAQADREKEKAKAKVNKMHIDVEIARQEKLTEIEINAFRARIAALGPEVYAQIELQAKWADAIAQMQITYPQIMTSGGNSGSGDSTSNLFNLLQIEHLTGLADRIQLNQGTSTPLFSTAATKNSLSPNQEQKSLSTHSTEPKIPVVLLLDTSSSMYGQRIDSLNDGITSFKQEFEPNTNPSQNVELAIITCNSNGRTVQEFVSIDKFLPSPLKAEGTTTIGKGIDLALDEIENYQNSKKPWVFLIIGSSPTDDWQKSAQLIRQAVEMNKLNFFVVAVQGADMISLEEIAPLNTPPKLLNGLKFRELFHWIAENLKTVSNSEPGAAISILPITEWAEDEY